VTDQQAFREQVYRIVRAIPPGRVLTYGDIGEMIPPPPGIDLPAYGRVRARWVGYALAGCPEDLPWQRVVNAGGGISPRPGLGPQVQRAFLEAEGVEFDGHGRLDLNRCRWPPPEAASASRSRSIP
jgi:methylated-DNA-protein-cysteine methyltransferase-like protein